MARQQLVANKTYHINPSSGSDTTGLGSVAFPWATMGHAYDWLQRNIDLSGYTVTLQAQPGLAPFTLCGPLVGQRSPGSLKIKGGASGLPHSITAIDANAVTVMHDARARLEGFKVSASGAGPFGCGVIVDNAQVELGEMWYGQCDHAHIDAAGATARVQLVGHQTVQGLAGAHVLAEAHACVHYSGGWACTIMNAANGGIDTYGFGFGFVMANELALVDFTGALMQVLATINGKKFHVESNSLIKGSAAFLNPATPDLPGNIAGTEVSGGRFI